ncbi:MAG TPA: hypothetical protein VHB21_16385, partial [Minicystis sp.]|nr:hypothetical protein [Minicystis sp.]
MSDPSQHGNQYAGYAPPGAGAAGPLGGGVATFRPPATVTPLRSPGALAPLGSPYALSVRVRG